jgi:glycosyltransferase involved in cell wall biosynthesis
MWETSRINTFIAKEFNEVSHIIVPCQWNYEVFRESGINCPITVVPLGVNTTNYSYSDPIDKNTFVFGTGNNDYRKRLKDVIRCFCRAFHPKIKDVKLKIKVSPTDDVGSYVDNRIEILQKNISQVELSNWYKTIDIFVSGAYAEGWGLMQHESMSCGKPLISPCYGGVKDFFNSDVGYPIDYKEVMATGAWSHSNGFWADFSEDSMIETMRWCYNNRENVYEKGRLASKKVETLNENNTIMNILNVIRYVK